jgi:hypothetical protein
MAAGSLVLPFGLAGHSLTKLTRRGPAPAVPYTWPNTDPGEAAGPNAVENFVRFRSTVFAGSEAFWTAEFGTMVVGSTVTEQYDTAAVVSESRRLKVLHQHKTT